MYVREDTRRLLKCSRQACGYTIFLKDGPTDLRRPSQTGFRLAGPILLLASLGPVCL